MQSIFGSDPNGQQTDLQLGNVIGERETSRKHFLTAFLAIAERYAQRLISGLSVSRRRYVSKNAPSTAPFSEYSYLNLILPLIKLRRNISQKLADRQMLRTGVFTFAALYAVGRSAVVEDVDMVVVIVSVPVA